MEWQNSTVQTYLTNAKRHILDLVEAFLHVCNVRLNLILYLSKHLSYMYDSIILIVYNIRINLLHQQIKNKETNVIQHSMSMLCEVNSVSGIFISKTDEVKLANTTLDI